MRRSRRPQSWSLLTRITVGLTGVLLVAWTLAFTLGEWHNPKALGPLDGAGKVLAGFFASVMPRTAGFNSLDVSGMHPSSWLATDVLMFIGGGSAGTAGGIKVTTFGMLLFMVWADMRGQPRVDIGHRALGMATQRQAVARTADDRGLTRSVRACLRRSFMSGVAA
ncbi:potassium transporter TrkG [Spongiactinospora gelatinilytica]|uniref:potassium transporter TrkG n=1 Tax=Spongiactinospora gelatinilytica TaxID=2666298 RepID=UPI001F1986C4|nr:potassium transporter TrkG [Spongiactinospora gelatinilytica]